MVLEIGRVIELQLTPYGRAAWIACSSRATPPVGRYLLAGDGVSPVSVALFSVAWREGAFLAAPPSPGNWEPGTRLSLRGPLGTGFSLPAAARRVALVSAAGDPSVLLALAAQAEANGADITLFASAGAPGLHPSIELYPLEAFGEARSWAEYIAMDVRVQELAVLRDRLNIIAADSLGVPAQVLVRSPMPCAALAGCGVCAVDARKGWLLACQDGPVFDLEKLDW